MTRLKFKRVSGRGHSHFIARIYLRPDGHTRVFSGTLSFFFRLCVPPIAPYKWSLVFAGKTIINITSQKVSIINIISYRDTNLLVLLLLVLLRSISYRAQPQDYSVIFKLLLLVLLHSIPYRSQPQEYSLIFKLLLVLLQYFGIRNPIELFIALLKLLLHSIFKTTCSWYFFIILIIVVLRGTFSQYFFKVFFVLLLLLLNLYQYVIIELKQQFLSTFYSHFLRYFILVVQYDSRITSYNIVYGTYSQLF